MLEERQGEELATVLEADAAVLPQELTVEAVEQLDWLEPCGTGNPRPVLVLTGAHVLSAAQVGRGRHLKLRLEARGVPLDAIFFSADGGELGLTATAGWMWPSIPRSTSSGDCARSSFRWWTCAGP